MPCWLTDSGLLNHKVVTHPASSLAQDRESSPAETSVLTTMLRRQPRNMLCMLHVIMHMCVFCGNSGSVCDRQDLQIQETYSQGQPTELICRKMVVPHITFSSICHQYFVRHIYTLNSILTTVINSDVILSSEVNWIIQNLRKIENKTLALGNISKSDRVTISTSVIKERLS